MREEIARGGAGVVFRAHDPHLQRDVAVKLLLRDAGDPESRQRERFLREGEALARLRHKNVLAVHAAGVDGRGQAYLVVDLIEGDSLQRHLERAGPLPAPEAAWLCEQLAEALSVAHRADVVHRDLKPSNVLMGPLGDPLLSDFGLALFLDSSEKRLTEAGMLLGTPGYWAPEQAMGDLAAMGPQTDVYGLGATLYALLTGAPPFLEDSVLSAVAAACDKAPVPPSRLRKEVPAELEAICLRCLAKAPEDRYASAAELQEALHHYRVSRPVGAFASRRAPVVLLALLIPPGILLGLLLARVGLEGSPGVDGLSGPGTPAATESALETPSDSVVPDGPGLTETQALAQRANNHFSRGEYAEAVKAWDSLLPLFPEEPVLWANRGSALFQLGDHEKALESLSHAIELEPDYPGASYNRGTVRLELRQIEGALEDFSNAIRLEPSERAYTNRAKANSLLNDHVGAVSDLTQAIKLNPAAISYVRRGDAYARLGNYARALQDMNQALKIQPDLARAHCGRGVMHGQLGQPDVALVDLTRAIAIDPTFGEAYYNRGVTHLDLDHRAQSIADLERAIQLLPPGPKRGQAEDVLRKARGE